MARAKSLHLKGPAADALVKALAGEPATTVDEKLKQVAAAIHLHLSANNMDAAVHTLKKLLSSPEEQGLLSYGVIDHSGHMSFVAKDGHRVKFKPHRGAEHEVYLKRVVDPPPRKGYRIIHPSGTYYKGDSGIGPCFGASKVDAMVFRSKTGLIETMMSHSFAFADCKIEYPDGTTT